MIKTRSSQSQAHRRQRGLAFIVLLLLLCASIGTSIEAQAIERRRDQFGKDYSYFLYPIAGEIPGLGTAFGIGASVLNMLETDTDFTGYFVRGDFEAAGGTLLDMHLIPKRLVLDIGYNDYLVAPLQYSRGIDSLESDFIQPKAEGYYLIGQLTLTFAERMFEAYIRHVDGSQRIHEILDSEGKAFATVDTDRHAFHGSTIGMILDLTDDRLDPRKGLRLEVARRIRITMTPYSAITISWTTT